MKGISKALSDTIDQTPAKVVILARCRRCSKARVEIIEYDANSSSVNAKKTLKPVVTTYLERSTVAPHDADSQTVDRVASEGNETKECL